MADDIPAEISQFIEQHIQSLAQLEALLLLRKDSSRLWDTVDFAKELYITAEMAVSLLADLNRRGFVQVAPPETRYAYKPDAAADRLLSELEAIYQTRRVAVISLIYSRPLNKVQTFADAFRLRKEESP